MTSTYALRDSRTMLRRDLRHLQRYPGLSLFPILMPVIFLLLFVYVFGATLGDGITTGGGRGAYINFLTPGMLLFTVAGAAQITAISVAKDMTEGLIARFKTMRIWRPAVLAGHVLSSLVLTVISLTLTTTVAVLIGYRSPAGPLHWLAALAILMLAAVALIWLSVAFGLFAKSVETASNIPMFLTLLPLLGSGFVPVNSPTSTSAPTASPRSCGASRSPPPATYGPDTSTTTDPSSRHDPMRAICGTRYPKCARTSRFRGRFERLSAAVTVTRND
jgi:ABC-2 type transport system permease protein